MFLWCGGGGRVQTCPPPYKPVKFHDFANFIFTNPLSKLET